MNLKYQERMNGADREERKCIYILTMRLKSHIHIVIPIHVENVAKLVKSN